MRSLIDAVMPEIANLEIEFALGQERIIDLLATTFAVHQDARVRSALVQRSEGPRTVVALESNGPYLVIEDTKLVATALIGKAPAGSLIDMDSASSEFPLLDRAVRDARPTAERLMLAMRDDGEAFPRHSFESLVRFARVVAFDVYRQSTLLQMSFDLGRARLLESNDPDLLRAYWQNVHLLSHMTMIATAAEPTQWLSEMAHTFTWNMWTPSFPLVRERTSRLAVRGGWAATRFGVSVVDRYLRNLDHRLPLKVFDAVLALVSIASTADNDRAAISTELLGRLTRRARSDEPYAVVHDALANSARLALEAPDEAEKAVVGKTAGVRPDDRIDALARAMDSDDDPATFDERGYFPAILAMAKLARTPAATFFPAVYRPTKRWRPARVVEALSRTLVRATDVN